MTASNTPNTSPLHNKALVISGGLLFGTLGIFAQEAQQDALTITWFRCAVGALALLAWGRMSGNNHALRLHGRSWSMALTTGLLMVITWALFFGAMARTSIAVATLVFHIQPIMTMALGAIFLRERLQRIQWVMASLCFVGLALATGLLETTSPHIGSMDYWIGLCMCVGAALAYAVVTLIAKTNRSMSPLSLVTWQCLVGAVLLAWWPWTHGAAIHASNLAWLACIGIIHTALAYILIYTGFGRLSTGQIAPLQFVYPLTAITLDWIVYRNTLSAIQLSGVLMMGIAIAFISRSR
ncbi:EamA family transporter [Curvibacter sp. CHRR-16]|uniref:DMT family transporter n=1 Tax=Curvibacter sp. CHRR-16 TaxID=2835872 RepID=UPI001BDA7348|nr:DMT family transporter [Curvibacter sp. CHRR-16]MBT0569797.1 EamA family transporter [Curvibacter sp. CHRR-16]